MNMNLNFDQVNELMIKKYKATIITKQKFKDLLYGINRTDLSDNIVELTEGIIKTDNSVFYLINDVEVLNNNCLLLRCDESLSNIQVIDIVLIYLIFNFIIDTIDKRGELLCHHT